ncbi:MAG: tetratricopeptide repeat protein, partial [Pseudomonadota bacterium]
KDYDDALATLGLVYIDGSMAEKDVEKGINYFQTAAKKGHVDSMFRLGMIYYQGDLVMKNLKQAHLWFTEAAAKGYKPAKEILSKEIFQTLRK